MTKRFRDCNLEQMFLLPPSFHKWLPENHLAQYIATVMDELDLAAFYAVYEGDGRGRAASDPLMMTRLLLYGYCTGVTSSRRIERATYEDLAFRFLSANQQYDHATIAAFRRDHGKALADLFLQVLRICEKSGLVKLGNVAIDGTKILANASTRRSVPYKKLQKREKYWEKVIADLLAAAEQTDGQEDQCYGSGPQAGPLPSNLATVQSRLETIRQAKAELEREAREHLEELERQAQAQKPAAASKDASTAEAPADPEKPSAANRLRRRDKAKKQLKRARQNADSPARQYNFVDPDSRVMPDSRHKTSFVQAYNAQAAVDSHDQVIVAAAVTQQINDKQQLVPMIQAVKRNTGRNPAVATADCGYWGTDSLLDSALEGIEILVPPDAHPPPPGGPLPASAPNNAEAQRMREVLATDAGQEKYRLRKAVVEPVFGQIKEGRHIRRFRMRGLERVSCEWTFICTTHNLLKLHKHRYPKPKPKARTKRTKGGERKPREANTAFCSHRGSPRRFGSPPAYSSQRANRRSGPSPTNRFSISDKLQICVVAFCEWCNLEKMMRQEKTGYADQAV
jgi:transposase